jgi:hypothetical protein
MEVHFKEFSGMFSWDKLYAQAAEFATHVGKDHLISITQSADGTFAMVVVWYWK